MKLLALLLLSLCASVASGAQTVTSWEQIPNVQLQDSTRFVSDAAGVLNAADEREINGVLQALRREKGVEGVVVILPSVGEETAIEDLSLSLLRGWGVGSEEDNSGFVLMAIMDRRQLRIETGYGLEGVLPDARCISIIDRTIAPYFKREAYGEGLIAGVREIYDTIYSEYEGAVRTDRDDPITARVILSVLLLTLGVLVVILMVVVTTGRNSSPKERIRRLRLQTGVFIPVSMAFALGGAWAVSGITILVVLILYFLCREHLRRVELRCPECRHMSMRPASMGEEVLLLTPGERREQQLGSVSHRVSVCTRCEAIRHYKDVSWQSPYKKCPHCGTYALRLLRTERLRTNKPGVYTQRSLYRCLYCHNDHHEDKVCQEETGIAESALLGAMLGSSMRGRGGFGGGFGGFGGGGFGGGSGGGGGATGSW